MGLQALLEDPRLTREQTDLRTQFFEETGYGPSDVLSCSYTTRIFLTRNGGQYRVEADGSIYHLAGPNPDPTERY
jgi:hypothetical protein